MLAGVLSSDTLLENTHFVIELISVQVVLVRKKSYKNYLTVIHLQKFVRDAKYTTG